MWSRIRFAFLVSTTALMFATAIVLFHVHLVRWPIAFLGLTADDFADVDVYSYDPRDQSVGPVGIYVGSSAIITTFLVQFASLSLLIFHLVGFLEPIKSSPRVLTDMIFTWTMMVIWVATMMVWASASRFALFRSCHGSSPGVGICQEVQVIVSLILVHLVMQFFYFCTVFTLACLGHLRGVPRAFFQPVVDGFWRVQPSKKQRVTLASLVHRPRSVADTESVYSTPGQPIRITFNMSSSMSHDAHLANDYELKMMPLKSPQSLSPHKAFVLGDDGDVCLADSKEDIKAKPLA